MGFGERLKAASAFSERRSLVIISPETINRLVGHLQGAPFFFIKSFWGSAALWLRTPALNLGKDWNLGDFTLGPIAGAQYTYLGVGAFTENGADSLDLAVDQQAAHSLISTLGGRIAYTWVVNKNLTLIPEVRLLWQHEFLNNSRTINSTLQGGAGASFGYVTADPDRDSAYGGAGITARIGDRWTASAFYNVDFGNPNFLSNQVSVGLNFAF
jgi:outer membrane autotransporter protein